MVANLDQNNYTDADLISIKVPAAHLSSYVNSKEFQRVDGKIEIEGVQYNYVKRRFSEDSLRISLYSATKPPPAFKLRKMSFSNWSMICSIRASQKNLISTILLSKASMPNIFRNTQSFAISNLTLSVRKQLIIICYKFRPFILHAQVSHPISLKRHI